MTRHSDLRGSGFADITNHQHTGYGFRTSLNFHRLTQDRMYSVEAYYIFLDIKDSDIEDILQYGSLVGYAQEPANETQEIGIRLLLRF